MPERSGQVVGPRLGVSLSGPLHCQDMRKDREVVTKGRPDTYRMGHIWVQPVGGGQGWLASCVDLAPIKEVQP